MKISGKDLTPKTALGLVAGAVPHAIRAGAMALAALALAWGLTTTSGLVSAMLGAVLGVILGHRLAKTRFRLSAILGAIVLVFLVTFVVLRGSVAWTIVPRIIGASTTLSFVEVVRFGVIAAALTSFLRATAVRRPTFMGVELAFVAVAITSVFSSHREGVISRPLWLADWAFHHDIDPAQILLGVGFVAVALLGTLLLVEKKSGRAISSIAMIAVLGVLGMLCISVTGAPKPAPLTDPGFTDKEGEPPPPPPEEEAGSSQPKDGEDGGAEQPKPDQGQDGGAQPQDGGNGGGKSDASPPPDAGQRKTDDPSNGGGPQPVAVVLFDDDYSPPSQAYYFRQEALSQWNGTRLVATGRGDADRDGLATFPTEPTKVIEPPDQKGRVSVRQTVGLLTEHNNPFGLESPVTFSTMPNPNPERFVRAYKVVSLAQEPDYKKLVGRQSGNPSWSPDLRSYYLLGPQDPRYLKLAQQYVKDMPPNAKKDPFAIALTVKLHLDHDLTYSTKVKYEGTKDPTADFLFGTKIGYCVHFAHAAVYLWRSLGLPARIGVGYHADEENRKGGSALLIRSGDAHAWPELYLSGVGWIVLDIAAERNLDPPGQPPDEDAQKLFGDLARKTPPDPEQTKPPPPHHYGRDFGIGSAVLLGLLLLALYAIKIWRRLAPVFAEGKALPRIGYRAALDMLAEVGFARGFGETREDFAARVGATAPSFQEITTMHVAARFRDPQTPPETRTELAKTSWSPALTRLRKDLSSHTKLWRRFVGALNPASFFASR